MEDIFLTKPGMEKLTEELKQLKQVKRPEIIKAIQEEAIDATRRVQDRLFEEIKDQ